MPVTISGDGGIAGISSLGGGDFVAGSLTSSGDLIAGPQAVDRATLFVDDSDNSVSINTTVTPAAGVFLQVADATDPVVSLNNTGNGEVRLGCGSAEGYIGTESPDPFVLTTNGSKKVTIAVNGNVGINETNPQSKLTIQGTAAEELIRLNVTGASYYHVLRPNGDGLLLSSDDGNTGGAGADIRFHVGDSEKMRIRKTGIDIGQGSVRLSNGLTSFIDNTAASTAAAFSANNLNNDGYNFLGYDAVNSRASFIVKGTGQIQSYSGSSGLERALEVYRVGNPNPNVWITTGGTVRASVGIDFGSTNDPDEILDDYEKGIWTPLLGKAGDGGYCPLTTAVGHYRKVGSLLWLSFYMFNPSGTFGSKTNQWYVDNIPFNLMYNEDGAFQSLAAGYQKINGKIYNSSEESSAGGRWQSNNVNGSNTLSLYSIIGKENWTSGILEFSGCGVVTVA